MINDKQKDVHPFTEKLMQVVENSILKVLKDGSWMTIDYHNRVRVDVSFLASVFQGLDMARVQSLVKDRLENYIADKIFNSMATEVSNDVKKMLADNRLREDIRSLLREKIETASKVLS